MVNKTFAVKRLVNFSEKEYKWWCVIDCGETREGGMTVGNFFTNHFSKDGRTYRYYAELFQPPNDLIEWQEIKTVDKTVTIIDDNGSSFNGFEDRVDEGLEILVKFSKLIGKSLSIDEVKSIIQTDI